MAAWIVRDRLPDSPVYVKVGSARFFYCLFPKITPTDRREKRRFPQNFNRNGMTRIGHTR